MTDKAYPDEDDTDPACDPSTGKLEVVAIMAEDTCDYDMTDHHADRSSHQELSASETIDEEDGWEGEQEVDDTKHARGEQRSGRDVQAKAAEDSRGVINNGVDALNDRSVRYLEREVVTRTEAYSELLEEHQDAAQGKSAEKTFVCEQHAHLSER